VPRSKTGPLMSECQIRPSDDVRRTTALTLVSGLGQINVPEVPITVMQPAALNAPRPVLNVIYFARFQTTSAVPAPLAAGLINLSSFPENTKSRF
jgi:hypothetical protein